jgi:uncharacterized protein (UPF0335 family)
MGNRTREQNGHQGSQPLRAYVQMIGPLAEGNKREKQQEKEVYAELNSENPAHR